MKFQKVARGNLAFSVVILAMVILADQLSKYFFLHYLAPQQSIPVFKNIFHLTLVFNRGVAFGLFKNQVLFYLILPFLAIAWLAFILFFPNNRSTFSRLYYFSLTLILGGAVGNLVDRLRFGFVVDFLDFRVWPVFNLADSAITVGISLIILRCIPLSAK